MRREERTSERYSVVDMIVDPTNRIAWLVTSAILAIEALGFLVWPVGHAIARTVSLFIVVGAFFLLTRTTLQTTKKWNSFGRSLTTFSAGLALVFTVPLASSLPSVINPDAYLSESRTVGGDVMTAFLLAIVAFISMSVVLHLHEIARTRTGVDDPLSPVELRDDDPIKGPPEPGSQW
jgi:hypothetical protein